MTVILVCYVNGKPYEELAAKCATTPRHVNTKNALNSEGASPSSSCSSSSLDSPDDEHDFLNDDGEDEKAATVQAESADSPNVVQEAAA